MATTREALTLKIRFLREQKDVLQAKLALLNSRIDALVAQRDALTPTEEAKIDALQTSGVLKVDE